MTFSSVLVPWPNREGFEPSIKTISKERIVFIPPESDVVDASPSIASRGGEDVIQDGLGRSPRSSCAPL